MHNVICDECHARLFATDKANKITIGVEAQSKGFIYKNACLFSDKYTSLIFCNDTCAKLFYSKNIKRNPEITKVINELKAEIPQMTKDCCEGLATLSKVINNYLDKQHGTKAGNDKQPKGKETGRKE